MLDYFYSKMDSLGYIHSLDNLVIEYYVEDMGIKCLDKIIDGIREIKDRCDVEYWEKLNCVPCSRYSYYAHHIHLDDGIYIQLGHYTDFDHKDKKPDIFPLIQLQVNPNKHYGKPALNEFLALTDRYCYGAHLVKYDYAIDIPLFPEDVQNFGSRKEKGLYKGTRYYGQRNKNGYCKIYDKQKEQDLETPLTRVEHTICLTKGTKGLSLEPVYIRKAKTEDADLSLSKTDSVIVEFCALCLANRLDYESIIDKLENRKRRSILEKLSSCSYDRLVYDEQILRELLDHVKNAFHFSGEQDPEKMPERETDGDAGLPDWITWDLDSYGNEDKPPF